MLTAIKKVLKSNKFICKMYEQLCNKFINKALFKIKSFIKTVKGKMTRHKYSFGQLNEDKTFAVLVKPMKTNGFFSYFSNTFFDFLMMCEKENQIPFVDLSGCDCKTIIDPDVKENPWEIFWQQPASDIQLSEVYQSKKVIIHNGYRIPYSKGKGYDLAITNINKDELRKWGNWIRKYLKPQKNILDRVEQEKSKLFTGEKVLGISVRSSFFYGEVFEKKNFNNHPRVNSCEEYIRKINDLLKEWDCDCIFLACDGREYSDKIANCFGDRCIRMERFLLSYAKKEISKEDWEGHTVRERTEDYLVETLLLAECDSLYASMCGQSKFACLYNGGQYRHIQFDEQGFIHNNG